MLVVLLHQLVALLRGLVARGVFARVGYAFAQVVCAFARLLCFCTGWVRRFFTATSLNLTDFCQVSECRENGQVSGDLEELFALLRGCCAFAQVVCAFARLLCICTGWGYRFFTATSLNLTDFCQVSECRENGQVSGDLEDLFTE